MKKILKSLLILLLVLVPVTVANAKTKKTTTTTTATAKPVNSQVTMYVFYGATCPHCAELEEYVKTTLRKDSRVKDFLNVVYYETWNEPTNSQFLSAVAQEMQLNIEGVPFILIGKDYFMGYGQQMNESIVAKLIEAKNDTKYVDIIEKVKKSTGINPVSSNPEASKDSDANEKNDNSKNDIIGIIILGVTVVIIIVIIFTRHSDEDEDDEEETEEVEDTDDEDEDDNDEDDDDELDDEEESEEEEKVVEVPKKKATNKPKNKKKNKKR